MANTTAHSTVQLEQWADDYFKEYVRESIFSPYMGTDESSAFQLREDLVKKSGDKITVQLVTKLSGAGVTGDNTLEGNEEALGQYGHQITIDQLRNGVVVPKMEQKRTTIDLLEAAKGMLKLWSMDNMRDGIIDALTSPALDNTVYASASEAQKDAWLAANSDRVLFGAAKGNNAANDHSAALLQIDSVNDVLTPAVVSLAKRMAKTADPHIRPIRVKNGREYYVLLCPSYAYRDYKAAAATLNMLYYAADRGSDNPLFTDGDLIYDGVVIREVPEIESITGVGGGAIDVAPCFLLGAQALGVAWGQRTKFDTDTFDYGNREGVALSEIRGIEKLFFNSVQHGVLTLYVANVADT